MTSWRQAMKELINKADDRFDALRGRLSSRWQRSDPIQIVPYRGFGTAEKLYLRGRVLEDEGVNESADEATLWQNAVNMFLRFESDEVPGAKLRAEFQGEQYEAITDNEGFFELWIEPKEPLPAGQLWHELKLELLEPAEAQGVTATGQILVPPDSAHFGVISDIDDTVIQTDVTQVIKMVRNVFLSNARTRLPFKGVAAFYQALQAGGPGNALNPLFYVSSSPWNLYDLLVDFFELNDVPQSVLFLRDWGVTTEEILPTRNREYKVAAIRQILEMYPTLPFILIGDTGQEDPEIYHEIVTLYPQRILAVYIRNVNRDVKRPAAVRALAEKVVAAGSTLILADNTLPMAEHAAAQGWIAAETLPMIWTDKEADTKAEELTTDNVEQTVVIEGESKAETQEAVAAGAVEAALEQGAETTDKPPTVIVEGDTKSSAE
jgi:phosphatidate phosphatase APP1